MTIVLEAGFGLRMLISGGNEAVVSFADYVLALANDAGTRVITAYLDGITDGPALVAALGEARRRGKPVVMIKSGASPTAARAAKAHTGALVGEDRAFDAVLQECGVIRVASVEEMVDVALVLADVFPDRMPRGNGVGIVTFGGGNGVLATDQAQACGLATPALGADCVERLRQSLLAVATAANPLDLTPSTAFRADALARLPAALDVFAAEPQIHAVMIIVGSLAAKAREISDVIRTLHDRLDKPVCVVWPAPPSGVLAELARHGIPAFLEPARGLRALGRLVEYHALAARPPRLATPAVPAFAWRRLVPERGPDSVITEDRCHALLAAAGLPVAPGKLAVTGDEAIAAAATLGFPVVLKAISAAVTHRAAAGLVAVDLRSTQEVAHAFAELSARAARMPVALDGIYVQKMIKGGAELLVAAFRDPMFGTMVSCGVGGGLTELVDDVVTRQAPVDEAAAADMIARLRSCRHLRPGGDDAATRPAAEFVAAFSRLAASAPWTRFTFEVNPVKWTADAAVAVDGLLIVEQD
jgi:acyl-CoA synthetase (NDP forming)